MVESTLTQDQSPQQHQEGVRLSVLRYLLDSPQDFRDAARGRQITEIREHYHWCESSILTVARSLSYWQSSVRVAPASPHIEAKRLCKKRNDHAKAIDQARREGESLRDFQQRVLGELPDDLRTLAEMQLGNDIAEQNERDIHADNHQRNLCAS